MPWKLHHAQREEISYYFYSPAQKKLSCSHACLQRGCHALQERIQSLLGVTEKEAEAVLQLVSR
jgi:hypothetical protein